MKKLTFLMVLNVAAIAVIILSSKGIIVVPAFWVVTITLFIISEVLVLFGM